jgi:hypothetical protein
MSRDMNHQATDRPSLETEPMKVTTQGLIGAVALFLASAVNTSAIEGLKISVECSDVILSWPSMEGEPYIVQYRPTLDPATPWLTLTSSLYADWGTNKTFFVHSNAVQYPPCDGGGSFAMMSGGEGEGPESLELELWGGSLLPLAMPKDGSFSAAPLILYPFGFDLSDFIIFDPVTGESLDGAGYSIQNSGGASLNSMDPNEPGDPEEGGSLTNSTPETGFYQVVRLGVDVIRLADFTNAPVEGIIALPFEAGNDMGTLQSLTLTVDYTRYRGVEPLFAPGINGKLIVDTRFLENGEHTFRIEAAWLNPDILDVNRYVIKHYGLPFTVTVWNTIYFPEWEDEVGELGFSAYFAKTTIPDADWSIEIYDVGSNYVQTLTGHTTDGLIETNWNMMDWQGVMRTNVDADPEFSSIISVVGAAPSNPPSGASTAATKPPPQKAPLPYPEHGRWVIAYQDTFRSMVNSNDYYGAIYDMGSIGANFGGAVTVFPSNPTNGQTFPLRYPATNHPVSFATISLDARALERLLTNTLNRNFFYNGHSGPNQIAVNLDTTWLSYLLKRTYYRFVFIDGCSSANGGLPAAFGINFNAPLSLTYFLKHGIRPRTYLGYSLDVKYAQPGTAVDPETGEQCTHTIPFSVSAFLSNFEFYWYFNYTLDFAIYRAMLDVPYIGPDWCTGESLKIFGYAGMHIDDYNWKYQWSN